MQPSRRLGASRAFFVDGAITCRRLSGMTLPRNGVVFKWLAGGLFLALISVGGVTFGIGRVALNHETRLTRVETVVEERLKSIEATLARLEAAWPAG